jgi:ABC-type multidrug transport system ATPase subunit
MNDSILSYSEPTSGLDSTSAVALMDVLRELALQGKTIITSIHQPSSQIFQSFDQLILLADGKTIFMVNNIEDVFNRKVFDLCIGQTSKCTSIFRYNGSSVSSTI